MYEGGTLERYVSTRQVQMYLKKGWTLEKREPTPVTPKRTYQKKNVEE